MWTIYCGCRFSKLVLCSADWSCRLFASEKAKPTAAASERGFGIQIREDYRRRCRIVIAAAFAAVFAAAATAAVAACCCLLLPLAAAIASI